MRKTIERIGECLACGECCKKLRITSVLSNIKRQHGTIEDARDYYRYHGVILADIDERGDRVMLEIDQPCGQLDEENRCRLHLEGAEKPFICQRYPWFEDDIETCGYSFNEKRII